MNVASAVSFVWDTKPDFPSSLTKKKLDCLRMKMPHGSTKPCKIKSLIIIKPCKPYIYIYIQAVQDQSART